MTPSEELDRLAQAVVDDELSENEQLHLAALLRDDPTAQAQYLDYLFLDSMLRWEKPAAPPARVRISRRTIVHRVSMVLAACLLIAACVGLIGLWTGRLEARPDLVERLADWSLAIADAPTPDDREQCYREQANAFSDELARANIPVDDREMAAALFANASTLFVHTNPLDEAEQLDSVAEQMLEWMVKTGESDSRRSRAMERHYLRFVERIHADLQRASVGAADETKKKRMKKLHDRVGKRTDARIKRGGERYRHKRKR